MEGSTISHYKILEKLGKGGMGEVWKAEDTRLQLTVALKFLSGGSIDNEEIKARLVREAQAAVSLDHPNICRVYGLHEDDGESFIAMAYIDGPSLAEKIRERPLPLEEALDIAIQIAEGLQEAHEQGIVHRDIKPHNVMLTSRGQVKIMDFGLALVSNRSRLTQHETTVGTPLYMAPEQLAGSEADRRADIWALGCVLYEMLTQRAPFEEEYEQAVSYSIMNEDPEPVTALRAGLPTQIDTILNKALAKDPAQRYQTLADLLVDLRGLLRNKESTPSAGAFQGPTQQTRQGGRDAPTEPRGDSDGKNLARWAVAALFLVILSGLAVVGLAELDSSVSDSPQLRRFAIRTEPPVRLNGWKNSGFYGRLAAVSPNGEYYSWIDHKRQLWIQNLAEDEPRLTGLTRAGYVSWTPDGQHVLASRTDAIFKVPVSGDSPTKICDLVKPNAAAPRATVSSDGTTVVFNTMPSTTLWQVPFGGGTPKRVFSDPEIQELFEDPLDGAPMEVGLYPLFLPPSAGDRVLVFGAGATGTSSQQLMILDMDTRRVKSLPPGANPVYSPTGHLIVERLGDSVDLWAIPFSVDSLAATGEAFLVRRSAFGPSISQDGSLLFFSDWGVGLNELRWLDRNGALLEVIGLGDYPRFSPDGAKVAFSASGNILIYDFQRKLSINITSDQSGDTRPVWSPDGEKLAFSSGRSGSLDLWTVEVDRAGATPKLLFQSEATKIIDDWSPDGHVISFYASTRGRPFRGMLLVHSQNSASWEPKEFGTGHGEQKMAFHPEGEYAAYQSRVSGDTDVYIEQFPRGGDQNRISGNHGVLPRWSGDGKELFYEGAYELGDRDTRAPGLYRVSVETQPRLEVGRPEKLFDLETGQSYYDVAPDGQSFIFSEQAPQPDLAVRVVENWYEEFK